MEKILNPKRRKGDIRMNQENLDKLIKALETRKKQLIAQAEEEKLPYPIHSGHHMRDVFTVLAILKNKPEAEKLLENMPKEE